MEEEKIMKGIQIKFEKPYYAQIEQRIQNLFGTSGDLTTYINYLIRKDNNQNQ